VVTGDLFAGRVAGLVGGAGARGALFFAVDLAALGADLGAALGAFALAAALGAALTGFAAFAGFPFPLADAGFDFVVTVGFARPLALEVAFVPAARFPLAAWVLDPRCAAGFDDLERTGPFAGFAFAVDFAFEDVFAATADFLAVRPRTGVLAAIFFSE
jgi:hypothetical protein